MLSESNFYNSKVFTGNLMAIEMRKAKVLMNKSAYLRLLLLDQSKATMYEFRYDYVKPK